MEGENRAPEAATGASRSGSSRQGSLLSEARAPALYDGKVGPARVKDDQYWFFADGVGPVARIDKKDISAMLVYRDKSKVAGVLVERR